MASELGAVHGGDSTQDTLMIDLRPDNSCTRLSDGTRVSPQPDQCQAASDVVRTSVDAAGQTSGSPSQSRLDHQYASSPQLKQKFRNLIKRTNVSTECWKCGFCSLAFANEKLLESHIHLEHHIMCIQSATTSKKSAKKKFNTPKDISPTVSSDNSSHPMISVGKRNAKKKVDNDFVVPKQKFVNLDLTKQKLPTDSERLKQNQMLNNETACPKQQSISLPYECLQCGTGFSKIDGLKTHNENKECVSSSKCVVCKKNLRSSLESKKHMLQCRHLKFEKHCHSLSLKKFALKHVDKSVVRMYKCFPCKRTFKNQRLLFIHRKRHSNAYKPFKCEICNESFAMKKWLTNHVQRHASERNYPCGICGKKYLTKSDAALHKRRHTLDRKFHCDVCQKKFVYRCELNSHLKKHQGVKRAKNMSCEVCGKMFATRRDLQRHSTVHTGEQPFECPLCGKRFSQEINMQLHIKIHTNIRPHKCEDCDKSFITRSKLLRHSAVHKKPASTLHKPYKCLLCPRQYTAENSLIRHLKKHRNSPGSVEEVTEVLNKALDHSKSSKNVSTGAVIGSLIDQAISDAKLVSKKERGKSVKTKSLADVIDEAIVNSKAAVSLGTQTPIVVQKEVFPRKPKTNVNTIVQIDISKEITDKDKVKPQIKKHVPIETVVVQPKSAVVNFRPTDHRKLTQNKSVLNPLNLKNEMIRCIPLQKIDDCFVQDVGSCQIFEVTNPVPHSSMTTSNNKVFQSPPHALPTLKSSTGKPQQSVFQSDLHRGNQIIVLPHNPVEQTSVQNGPIVESGNFYVINLPPGPDLSTSYVDPRTTINAVTSNLTADSLPSVGHLVQNSPVSVPLSALYQKQDNFLQPSVMQGASTSITQPFPVPLNLDRTADFLNVEPPQPEGSIIQLLQPDVFSTAAQDLIVSQDNTKDLDQFIEIPIELPSGDLEAKFVHQGQGGSQLFSVNPDGVIVGSESLEIIPALTEAPPIVPTYEPHGESDSALCAATSNIVTADPFLQQEILEVLEAQQQLCQLDQTHGRNSQHVDVVLDSAEDQDSSLKFNMM